MPALDWTVQTVLVRHPEAAPAFGRFGMACVGCVMAPFETLAEAAAAYGLDPERLLGVIAASCAAAPPATTDTQSE